MTPDTAGSRLRITDFVTSTLDLAGIGLIGWFAWLLWWPFTLLVGGAAALVISWQLSRRAAAAALPQAADGSRLI